MKARFPGFLRGRQPGKVHDPPAQHLRFRSQKRFRPLPAHLVGELVEVAGIEPGPGIEQAAISEQCQSTATSQGDGSTDTAFGQGSRQLPVWWVAGIGRDAAELARQQVVAERLKRQLAWQRERMVEQPSRRMTDQDQGRRFGRGSSIFRSALAALVVHLVDCTRRSRPARDPGGAAGSSMAATHAVDDDLLRELSFLDRSPPRRSDARDRSIGRATRKFCRKTG